MGSAFSSLSGFYAASEAGIVKGPLERGEVFLILDFWEVFALALGEVLEGPAFDAVERAALGDYFEISEGGGGGAIGGKSRTAYLSTISFMNSLKAMAADSDVNVVSFFFFILAPMLVSIPSTMNSFCFIGEVIVARSATGTKVT
jgi:hypothetical protein